MIRYLALLLAPLALACGAPGVAAPRVTVDTTTPYWPGAGWRTADAFDVGIDVSRLNRIVDSLRREEAVPGIHSFVMVRHGYLVAEQYYQGGSAASPHTMQSVTKSVTSLLVGIAAGQGKLSANDKVLSFFPEYFDLANMSPQKEAVTVGSLLAMRSGIDFHEQPYEGSPLQQLNQCTCDWLRLVLDRPMASAPGQAWGYNSGGAIVLGGVIRKATGLTADDFADEFLFKPLGINFRFWSRGQPNALPHMGGGLSLLSADLARIGYLVLRNGRWNDVQVVPEAWIAASTSRVTTLTPKFFPRQTDYGLMWWLIPRNGLTGAASGDDYIVAASGTGGQWLFVDRKKQLVAVFTGSLSSGTWPAFDLFMNQIQPIVH